MDSTVIQEIANQLGMAVDSAGAFIADNLPAYASLKAMQALVPIAIVGGILLALLLVALVAALLLRSFLKRDRADGINRGLFDGGGTVVSSEDYISMWVVLFALVLALATFIVLTFVVLAQLSDLIGWSSYPQAMLIDSALKAIG